MKLNFKMMFILLVHYTVADMETIINSYNYDVERIKINTLAEIVHNNLKYNGWNNMLFVGPSSNALFDMLKTIPFTNTITDIEEDDEQLENVVPYHSNVIIITCFDFKDFENAMRKTVNLAYWHPLSNIILNYHAPYDKEIVAKIFFAFWYYRAINVIIIHYNDNKKSMLISQFNPYVSDNYKLDNTFGCWTAKKISMPVENFEDSFVCVKQCHNVSLHSKLRAIHLGTCIGFDTHLKLYAEKSKTYSLSLFEDKGKNLHGFMFRAFTVEVLPFLGIKEHDNGSYSLYGRDGMIWNTMAELFNFSIDFSAKEIIKQKFDFENNIQQVFSFTQRKEDLILFPLYQFDLIIAEVDYTFPFMGSGVCFLSRRAEFETLVFNAKLIEKNLALIIQFLFCFICTWFVFFIFHLEQLGKFSYDQAGKDLINTFRTILSISLFNPPKKEIFRIFLIISIWSFFVINFNTQASIISLFSAQKRGKDVDTFEDIIKKGYKIQGMGSPDVVLPETEEKYVIITSRIEAMPDMFKCVHNMINDSHRFCIIDCAVGRYLVRNMLDEKGEQFLHIASKARIHSHYLNMILHKNSPMTDHFNDYMIRLFEAGIIRKWMDYRFKNILVEVPIKPLGMKELEGIFKCYCLLVGISVAVFTIEVLVSSIQCLKINIRKYLKRIQKTARNLSYNKFKSRKQANMSTQTI